MAFLGSDAELIRWPDRIAVVGGGRWARVSLDVLCKLVPASVKLSVYTRSAGGNMIAWQGQQGHRGRIEILLDFESDRTAGFGAVIVANAARDHQCMAERALRAGIPVMVEKPIAANFAAAQGLSELAAATQGRLAAAQVFLFARYLDNFSKTAAKAGRIESLHCEWTDPAGEERYGESKRYDASLPVMSDWLPHIVAILGLLHSTLPDQCKTIQVCRGGAAVALSLDGGGVPCTVWLERNANRRQRMIRAKVGNERVELDFSTEPGVIYSGSTSITGDPDWNSQQRPLARMLGAFLLWAGGGVQDSRLDIGTGLRACDLIEQAKLGYDTALTGWLLDRLRGSASFDDDLRYTLTELLQMEGPLTDTELERQISTLTAKFSGMTRSKYLDQLTRAIAPVQFIRALAKEGLPR